MSRTKLTARRHLRNRMHGGMPVKEASTNPPKEIFKCNKCEYQTYKVNIKLYEEIHQGEILFHCKFCRAPSRNDIEKTKHEKTHQVEANQKLAAVVKTEPRVKVACRTPQTTAKNTPKSKSAANPTAGRPKIDGGQSSGGNSGSSPILLNSNGRTKRTRQQMNHQQQDETEEDDDVEVCEPTKKLVGHTRELVPRDNSVELVQQNGAGASSISSYANIVVKACAQSNLVTFHGVNTIRNTIDKITFQFECNKCRGKLGVARCYRGRDYCITCCGHPD